MRIDLRVRTLLLVVAACSLAGGIARSQNGETFKVRLSTVPVDAQMMETVSGSGSVTAVLLGTKLTINGTFDGLRSPATDIHVHRGIKGVRGPVILDPDLKITKATSGTITGSIDLTPSQVEDLKASRLYIELNSEGAPEGNLWGWLLR